MAVQAGDHQLLYLLERHSLHHGAQRPPSQRHPVQSEQRTGRAPHSRCRSVGRRNVKRILRVEARPPATPQRHSPDKTARPDPEKPRRLPAHDNRRDPGSCQRIWHESGTFATNRAFCLAKTVGLTGFERVTLPARPRRDKGAPTSRCRSRRGRRADEAEIREQNHPEGEPREQAPNRNQGLPDAKGRCAFTAE